MLYLHSRGGASAPALSRYHMPKLSGVLRLAEPTGKTFSDILSVTAAELPRSYRVLVRVRLDTGHEANAHAWFGEEVLGPRRIGLELPPDLTHEDPEVIGLVDVGRAPHFFEELSLCHQPTRITNEDLNQMPLSRREPYLCSGNIRNLLVGDIDSKSCGLNRRGLLIGWTDSAKGGSKTGEQLAHTEGLGHVVVGTGIERRDLLGLLLTGGQNNDRDGCPASQSLHNFDTLDARETEVHNGCV